MEPENKIKLPRSISDSSLGVMQEISEMVQNDVTDPPDPLKPRYLLDMPKHSICLPPLKAYPQDFQDLISKAILDKETKSSLEDSGVLNWCRTAKQLYPISTIGDGNCLMHAASLAMWGYHDNSLFLRKLVYLALVEDTADVFKRRWVQEKEEQNKEIPNGGLHLNTGEWEEEWDMQKKLSSPDKRNPLLPNELPYASLEEIHIFVLANVLRRPIIVLADSVVRNYMGSTMDRNNLGGIYLPLLWRPSECVKSPLVFGYESNHFVALVSVADHEDPARAVDSEHVVPLVTRNFEQLVVHFPMPDEEVHITDLLQDYLDVTEICFTTSDAVNSVLSARLSSECLNDELNLTRRFFQETERLYNIFSDMAISKPDKEANANPGCSQIQVEHEIKPCETKGCNMFGTAATRGLCSRCFLRYTLADMAMAGGNDDTVLMTVAPLKEPQASAPITSLTPIVAPTVNSGHMSAEAKERGKPASIELAAPSEECRTKDCKSTAAKNVWPYCYDCYNHREMVGSLIQEEESLRVASQSHPGYARSHSLDHHLKYKTVDPVRAKGAQSSSLEALTPTENICVAPNCEFAGLEEWKYLCSQHWKEYSAKVKKRGGVKATPGLVSKVTAAVTSSVSMAATTTLAAILSTVTTVTPSTAGGIMSASSKRHDNPPCKNKNCNMFGTVEFQGYCSHCYLNAGSENHTASLGPDLSTMQILLQLGESPSSDFRNARLFVACKTNGCKGVSGKDTEGYCFQCYVKMYRENKTSATSTKGDSKVKEKSSASQKPKGACSIANCLGIRSQNALGLCFFCHDATKKGKTPIPNQAAAERKDTSGATSSAKVHFYPQNSESSTITSSPSFSTSKPCIHLTCNNPGLDINGGLCNDCHLTLCKQDAERNREAVSKSAVRKSALRSAPKTAKKVAAIPLEIEKKSRCLNQGCTMYGTLDQQGFCSQCYFALVTKATTGVEQPEHILQPVAPAAAPCRETRCDAYGDLAFQGYCSKCYRWRQQKQQTHSQQQQQQQRQRKEVPLQYAPEKITPAYQPNIPPTESVHQQLAAASGKRERLTSYEKLMAEQETAARNTTGKCKNPSCKNLGNSRSQGYCNSCHALFLAGVFNAGRN